MDVSQASEFGLWACKATVRIDTPNSGRFAEAYSESIAANGALSRLSCVPEKRSNSLALHLEFCLSARSRAGAHHHAGAITSQILRQAIKTIPDSANTGWWISCETPVEACAATDPDDGDRGSLPEPP